MMPHRAALVALALLLAPTTLAAQTRPGADQDAPPPVIDPRPVRAPEVSAGRIGERQTRADAAAESGIRPLERRTTRIANRVQLRLRNRIDRNYDPTANATSPFAIAEDQARTVPR
ncbi:hypothetical protein [Sphingomonas baiyangensis]|uniref:Uncharacterized protein n=1 Tax=Sphingomonas baiyangensis TaxID=2572576 RepID=A0A4V5PWJ8_9SPHN|nr:hypothetical protein [Sphingomonas baiyangensis]TKD51878.1 hypothetical protein FBR43_14850 [Sphingomonas baiyangensis]